MITRQTLRPTTISIPLQRAEVVEECPKIERCPLEVVAAEHGQVLSVDTGVKGTKVVRIGIFREDRGCDYKVRIGLVAQGGLVAVGDTPLLSGRREVWESLLPGCADNEAPLFAHKPTHLSQVRYLYKGEIISLFHYGYSVVIPGEETKHYGAVSVLRGGKMFTRNIEARDSAQIYGALSENFVDLYISTSTSTDGIHRSISYERLTWNPVALEWGQSLTGQVPPGGYDKTQDFPAVDRQGRIYAYASYTADGVVNDADGNCDEWGDVNSFWSYNRQSNNQTGHFYLWDIDSQRFIESPSSFSFGLAIADGDYHVIKSSRNWLNRVNLNVSGGADYVIAPPGEYLTTQHVWYTKSYAQNTNCYTGTAAVNGHPIFSSQDGVVFSYQANFDSYSDNGDRISYKGKTTISHSGYVNTNGLISSKSMAGWGFVHDLYASHRPDSNDFEVVIGQVLNTVQYCTGSYPEMNVFGIISESVDRSRAVWPVQFSYYSLANAFYVWDQMIDTWYAGAMVNHVEGGAFEWMIFKDGSRAVFDPCLGNLFANNFSCVYFR